VFVCDSLSRALSTRVDEPATDAARSDVGALFTEHWRVVPHRVCGLAHRYSSEEKGLMAEVEAEVHVLHAEDHFDEYLLKRWIDVFGMEGVFRNKVGRHAPCAVTRFVCGSKLMQCAVAARHAQDSQAGWKAWRHLAN